MNENMDSMSGENDADQYEEALRWVNPKDGSVHIFKSVAEKMQFMEDANKPENN